MLDTNVLSLALAGLDDLIVNAANLALAECGGCELHEIGGRLLKKLRQLADTAYNAKLLVAGCGHEYKCVTVDKVVDELRKYWDDEMLALVLNLSDRKELLYELFKGLPPGVVHGSRTGRVRIGRVGAVKLVMNHGPRVDIVSIGYRDAWAEVRQASMARIANAESADPFLIALARRTGGTLVTTDYRLAWLADLMGVKVLFLPTWKWPEAERLVEEKRRFYEEYKARGMRLRNRVAL